MTNKDKSHAMPFRSLRDLSLTGKTVLLRADLNVPAQDGTVTDTTRIDRLRPTIDFLRRAGAKVLILAHFGRPEGTRDPAFSLRFLLPALEKSWGVPVRFAEDCIGAPALALKDSLQSGEIGLLENVRFHAGEEANDKDFARQLAAPGDIYINDAFSAAHRAHASTEGLAHLLPAAAGLLMEEELNALCRALEHPQKPVLAVAGGSKISTKLKVLNNLVAKVDYLVLGGAMANTFLLAQGANVGSSMCEKDMIGDAQAIMQRAQAKGCTIVLPDDLVCVRDLKPGAESQTVPARLVPDGLRAVDAGPQSIAKIEKILDSCKTVLWNGPMGVFEVPPFDAGTNALARAVSVRTRAGKLVSVAGGGDTVAALEQAGVVRDFTYVSTAGGAFLEWLEGRTLPGVAALGGNRQAA